MDRSQVIRNILNSDENRLGQKKSSGLPFAMAIVAGFIIITILLSPASTVPMDEVNVEAESAGSSTSHTDDDETTAVALRQQTDSSDLSTAETPLAHSSSLSEEPVLPSVDNPTVSLGDNQAKPQEESTIPSPDAAPAVTATDNTKLNDLFPPQTQQKTSDRYFRDGLLFAKAKDYINGTNGRKKDYTKAVPILKDLVTRSSSSARFELAKLYRFGQGVPQDMNRAVQLYREGALSGNQDCQCSLGALYYKGNGVTKSYTEAVKYFAMAAKLGDRTAQFNLGCSYLDGTGVEKNTETAREWLQKSAAQDYAPAKKVLKAAFPD